MLDRYKVFCVIFYGPLWILLLRGFLFEEFLPFLSVLNSPIVLLTDIVFLILGLWALRSLRDILVFGSFMIIAFVSAYLNSQPTGEFLNGFREFIGLLFALPIIRRVLRSHYAERFVEGTDRQLRIFLYIQAVCLIWQFLRYGPGDHGGGSMGFGASGITSSFIYILCFYFINKKWDDSLGYFQNLMANKEYLLLLLPTFTNETKASFVFFLFFFVLLMHIDRKFVIRLILASPLFLAGVAGVIALYVFLTPGGQAIYKDNEFLIEYIVGQDLDELVTVAIAVQEEQVETDNLWSMDIPRVGKLLLVPDALHTTKGGMAWGAGIGQFKGGQMVAKTPFARKFNYMLQGTVPLLFFMVIQLGIIGSVWMILNFATTYYYRRSTFGRLRNIAWYLWMVTLLVFFYNDQFRLSQVCFMFFYVAAVGLQPAMARTENEKDEKTSLPPTTAEA